MDFSKLVDEYKEDIIKDVQEIVKIKSIEEEALEGMPFGEGPYRALEHALKRSKEMGFNTKDFDGYAGHAEFGEGEEVVGVLGHLDVVPEGTGWSHPPYGAEIHDDKIYGRGTIDDKGPTIAALYAMKILKDSNVDLSRKIRMIFGTNEETNWDCMKHYFENQEPPTMAFTPDAGFPVVYGEKGVLIFDLLAPIEVKGNTRLLELKGGIAANMVPDYCEALVEMENIDDIDEIYFQFKEKHNYPMDFDYPVRVEKQDGKVKVMAEGVGSHGGTPEKGENAITYMMQFLAEIFNGEDKLSNFIRVYNNRIAFYNNGEKLGCGLEDDISGKLNFNPGVIKLENGSIKLTINIRYPIKSSKEEVFDGIRENLKDTDIELIQGDNHKKAKYVPEDKFLVQKLMEVYREETGDLESKPQTISGATYARTMENAVAFGPIFPGQERLAHQKDEFISIDHLMKLTKIYTKALYELAK